MANLIDRFGLSALSKKYKDKSLNEEFMINKESGEFLIKTTSGNIVSFDYLSRLNHHIEDATVKTLVFDVFGDLYSLDFDDINLPDIITEGANILSEPMLISNSNLKKLYISIDEDTIINGDTTILDNNDCIVKLDFRFSYNDDIKNFSIIASNGSLKEKVIKPINFAQGLDNYKCELTGITINRNINSSTKYLNFIIYSIIFAIEK